MPYVTEETITRIAEDRWGTAKTPRMAELMTTLVRYLHAYIREVELTEDEWMAAIEWLTAVGKACTDKRQEFILTSDVLGVSMLVVQMNNRFENGVTPATVLGPFHIADSPPVPYGFDMSEGLPGDLLYVHGKITDVDGNPVANAPIDVWQADSDGKYESQVASDIDEARLRALYQTEADGRYCITTIAPLGYSIPMDGPVGALMKNTRISHMRPAHLHFLFNVPGYKRLITHIFRKDADFIETDVVYGVKEPLIVPFVAHKAGEKTPLGTVATAPFMTAQYDFVLEPDAKPAARQAAGVSSRQPISAAQENL